jgi:hypothetical protein
MKRSTAAVPLLVSLLAALLAAQDAPRTVPEATGFAATSRAADVERFLAECTKLAHGDLLQVSVAGTTSKGRPLQLVKVAAPAVAGASPRVRALVIANIHAGEVEGKESVQQLVREFASGEHADVLQRCEVWFVPIYNVDGNEAVGLRNREGQNGPDEVGERANGQGLDLNRDFVKADAPETRALLALFRTVDPHLFVDLHTTDGSYHGYELTYAPSLSPNVDVEIARLSRSLLDEATAALKKQHGFATFDYGNFETRDWDGGGAPSSKQGERGWYTYDHRPRYGVNYFGLRDRVGILSEAYSFADFATRIAVTRAFVLTLLERLAARADEVLATAAAADQRLAKGVVTFGYDTTWAAPVSMPVLAGAVDKVAGADGKPARYVRKGDGTPETMPVVRAFQARAQRALPAAWAIAAPSAEVLAALRLHGVEFTTLDAARTVDAQVFHVQKKKKPKPVYQGHQELVLQGEWLPAAASELPRGAIVVPATQRLGRVAAQLLEPESEDSLSTWNFFEADTGEHYPVLRLAKL